MVNLKFNARAGALIEKEIGGKSIATLLQNPTIANIATMFKYAAVDEAGKRLKLTEDEIYDKLDEALEEMGQTELMLKIQEKLFEAGILMDKVHGQKTIEKTRKLINEQYENGVTDEINLNETKSNLGELTPIQ